MKKTVIFILILLFSGTLCIAQGVKGRGSIIERLYVSTDKECYVAGEAIWISLFCFDANKEPLALSNLSSVAYIELRSSTGIAAKTKVALIGGRGSGRIELPNSTPTGNYRMIAYTSYMRNETSLKYFDKVLSIYNTLSNDRDNSCVIEEPAPKDSLLATPSEMVTLGTRPILVEAPKTVLLSIEGKEFKPNSEIKLTLSNKYDSPLSLSVSVVNEDHLTTYKSLPIYNSLDFKSGIKEHSVEIKNIPEYEGEIVRGRVTPIPSEKSLNDLSGQIAFLSVPGSDAEIYTSKLDSSGRFKFYTTNIFGNVDLIVELPYLDTNYNFNIEFEDNFAYPKINKVPRLLLKSGFENDLVKRSVGMQVSRRYGVDTIFSRKVPAHNPLLSGKHKIYLLDNYTRFPVMEEVMIEFIPELRFKKIDKKYFLQVRWENNFNELAFSTENTLTLIDGIPIFNHTTIHRYDPLKVKSINIHEGIYNLGDSDFTGIIEFNTYKGDYPNLNFAKNARILGFNGTSIPCRLTGKGVGDNNKLPDYRTTIFWDPDLRLTPKGAAQLKFYSPDYPGEFVITVEGIDSSGRPIYLQTRFTVI